MSSSFRSHFRYHPRREDSVAKSQGGGKTLKKVYSTSSAQEDKDGKSGQVKSSLSKRSSLLVSSSVDTRNRDSKSDTAPAKAPLTSGSKASVTTAGSNVPQRSESRSAANPTTLNARYNNLQPPSSVRTPSLVSGSSATTLESPRSLGLRRKPSTIDKYAAQKRQATPATDPGPPSIQSRSDGYQEAMDDAILGTVPPSTSYLPSDLHHYEQQRPGLAQQTMSSRNITPPTRGSALSATPSTICTDSPFSHVQTPSSASSYSPGIPALTNVNSRIKAPPSATKSRPPVSLRQGPKEESSKQSLTPVRELSNSSSNSTTRTTERRASSVPKESSRTAASTTLSSKPSISRKPVPVKAPTDPTKRTSTSSSGIKPTAQIPPELAHLNVDHSPKANLQKPLPPIRPSREGTPNLYDAPQTSATVQSDLPRLYTTWHKRTPSQDTPASASSATSPKKSRFGLTSRTSPRIDSAISPPPSANVFARGPTSDQEGAKQHVIQRRDSPAVGPAPSPSKSPRFGFFSRKPKVEPQKPVEKPKREHRKGPAAGTGHEGYGRFGIRGRSTSSASNSSAGRSPSAGSSVSGAGRPTTTRKGSFASSKSSSELDDFLSERLNPIVLRGSGSTISDVASGSDTLDLSSVSTRDRNSKLQLIPSTSLSDRQVSLTKRPVGLRRPSDSSEDDVNARYPSLAARRSITKLNADDKARVKIPAPIDTTKRAQHDSRDSYDGHSSTTRQAKNTFVQPAIRGTTANKSDSSATRAEPASKSTRKWNFFQRAHSSPRKGKEKVVEASSNTQSPHHGQSRKLAHYSMLDPVDLVDLSEVERIVMENPTSGDESASEARNSLQPAAYGHRQSTLLPSPPKPEFKSKDSDFTAKPTPPRIHVRQESLDNAAFRHKTTEKRPPSFQGDKVQAPHGTHQKQHNAPQKSAELQQSLHTPELSQGFPGPIESLQGNTSPRQPRLSPVGRIPRVVSKRDRDRKLPDNSFSRPFARTQPRPTAIKPPGGLYNSIRELASPVEGGSQPVSSTSGGSASAGADRKSSLFTEQPSLSTNRTSMDVHQIGNEFMTFPARKGSEQSYSSSSGNASWLATTMATQPPQEEDIWTEYNDLLDDVMPQSTPISAGSSLGAPFQYTNMLYDNSPALPPGLLLGQTPSQILNSNVLEMPRSSTVPAVLSVPQQIARFMHPSMSPITPNTLLDWVSTYQDRTSTVPVSSSRQSRVVSNGTAQSDARVSVSFRNSRGSSHSRSTSLPEAATRTSQQSIAASTRMRDSHLRDIAEHDQYMKKPGANLRFGALMTSKWLSFGQVLFSPAHNEMRLADEPRVLVMDGLGSDWSHYVALSYPEAAVYYLGPADATGSADGLPSKNWKPLPNHRHFAQSDFSAPFPFPKGFFTAVVFRFPRATTDQAYHACICECKRVLRPGGHLEVAVLDLDLMNMDNRARRAVRGLKTRMQEQDPSVSLRNLSDQLVRFIGRRGFEEVQRCVVGVPAAGYIPRSQDLSSMTSSDENGSKKPLWEREGRREKTFSLSDLLEDPLHSTAPPQDGADEAMTKMASKVGRWWYSTCYESLLMPHDKSIWKDHALLRECEKQGTSFRLLICHAQKPTQTRRRTMSV